MFRLHWLRETGCDAGTPLRADELDPEIRQRALELAGDTASEIVLKLPYLSQREWYKRGEILAAVPLKRLSDDRYGDTIAAVLAPPMALRDRVAELALTHPAWVHAPGAGDLRHFAVWQEVSMALQRCFRDWIHAEYFQDAAMFEDRETAYAVVMYKTARLFRGRARREFTYDLHDYPECRLTVALALKMTGLRLQDLLAEIEQRLHSAGRPELARRYAPVWYQDVVAAVRKKPKGFIALLTAESAFINALIELSLDKTHAGVQHFSKAANQALRKVYGMDLRHLGTRALEEVTRVLSANVDANNAEGRVSTGPYERDKPAQNSIA